MKEEVKKKISKAIQELNKNKVKVTVRSVQSQSRTAKRNIEEYFKLYGKRAVFDLKSEVKNGKITLKSSVKIDNYVNYVFNAFDIAPNNEVVTEIKFNIEELNVRDFNLGVILGKSGSGKTTILKCIGELKKPQYDDTKAIISNFTWLSEEEVCRLFSSVGLSSIPTYLRKIHELSLGEKARVDLGYLISTAKDDEIILCDEYGSLLDRDWAMSMSYTLQRYIRKINKKIILATSNADIIEWVQPDWILNLNKPQDDTVNIEWQIYADDKEYETYKKIAAQDMLTETKELP